MPLFPPDTCGAASWDEHTFLWLHPQEHLLSGMAPMKCMH